MWLSLFVVFISVVSLLIVVVVGVWWGGGGEGVFNLCCETAVFGLLTCRYPFFLFFFFFLVCSFEEKEMG